MKTRLVQVVAWTAAVVSLLMVPLSFAPFTPAVLLTALLLPLAAVTAWRGAVLPSAIVAVLCASALVASPVVILDTPNSFVLVMLLSCGFLAVSAGLFNGWRRSRNAG